jgi:hypothetical protein
LKPTAPTQESKVLKPLTAKERIYTFLDGKPEANIYEIYFEFPSIPKATAKFYKCMYHKELRISKNELTKLVENLSILMKMFKLKVKLTYKMKYDEKEALAFMEAFLKKRGIEI